MKIADYLSQWTGKPVAVLFQADPLVGIAVDADGDPSITYWHPSLVPAPSAQDLAGVAALPDLPQPHPASVSRAQFFHAAAIGGIITADEGLAVFKGVIPASLFDALATLSEADKMAAEFAIVGNATFERANPMLVKLGAAMGKTPTQIDDLFILAATL